MYWFDLSIALLLIIKYTEVRQTNQVLILFPWTDTQKMVICMELSALRDRQ